MLANCVGFAHGTTGGLDGPTLHVTNADDDGEGSLRQAVAGDDPKWVVFDGDYTIKLSQGIDVGSNTTIDGRGRKVTLTGHGQYGLIISSGEVSKHKSVPRTEAVTNVIVENLILSDFGDVEKTKSNDPYDAIHIGADKGGQPADLIWIDHCDLSKAGDKLISIGGGGR